MSMLSRREFTEMVAAAAVAPLIADPSGRTRIRDGAEAVPPPPADVDAEARALTDAVRAKYGDRLSVEELETVRRQIADTLRRAERLRAVELANGDEPDFVFTAHAAP
jgi:hypothetical protein